jgi:hypothetical protein
MNKKELSAFSLQPPPRPKLALSVLGRRKIAEMRKSIIALRPPQFDMGL